jgi:subtilisin-like proprotein convertase family protein
MKTKELIAAAAVMLATGVWPALAQTNTQLFSFTVLNGLVPDADYNGFADTRTITVANPVGSILTDIQVNLNLTGGYNGDLYAYLTHGSGFAVLLNRVGRTGTNAFGYGDAGFNVTLSDSAPSDIHNYGGNAGQTLTGLWQPDARNTSPASVLDTFPRSAFLGSFAGQSANGPWTLFVGDFAAGDQSTLTSWSLQVTTIPEPGIGTLALAAAALLGLKLYRFPGPRRWTLHSGDA